MSTPPRGGAATAAPAPLRSVAAWSAPLALLALAGCGTGIGEPVAGPSTVTVTAEEATPSASAPAPSAPSAEPTAVPAADPARLPKQERGHDVAYVATRTDTPDGVVLSIDRLTVVGVPDEELAASGTPVRVDDGTAFTNQAQKLYDVGVSPQARFFLTTCTATPSGPTIASESVDLDTFLAAPEIAGTAVSLVYVDGLVDRAETNPRC